MSRGADGRQVIDAIVRETSRLFVPLLLISICINLLALVMPIYMLQIYDRVVPSGNLTTLLLLSIVAVSLLLIACVLTHYRSRVATRMGTNISHRLVRPVFDLLLKARLANETPDNQLYRDLDEIREFFVGGNMARLLDIPWSPIFLAVLFAVHPLIGVIASAAALILLVTDWLVQKGQRARHESSVITKIKADRLLDSGLKKAAEIWSMGLHDKTSMTWHQEYEKVLTARAESADFLSAHNDVRRFIQQGAQMAMLGIGAFLAVHDKISAGAIVAGSIICSRALSPILGICGAWQQFQNVKSALTRMGSEADRKQIWDVRGAFFLPRDLASRQGMDFRVTRLSIDLGDGRDTSVGSLEFCLERGQTLAIIGPESDFKSRLIETLIGGRRPGHGRVILDKISLHEIAAETLQILVGYASPEVTFYDGTFGDNIACFREIDQHAIDQVMELVGLGELPKRLPNGYQTPMTTAAGLLSPTQLKCVALARALYNDPPLLVLDRIDEGLEPASLQMLSRIIQRARTLGQIVIVATTKNSMLQQLDQALVLSGNDIVAFCPVQQLAEQMAIANRHT